MDGLIAVCHFCEQHGPSVVFCTQCHQQAALFDEQKVQSSGWASEQPADHPTADQDATNDCAACTAFSDDQQVCVVSHSSEGVSYVSTRAPLSTQLAALLKRACVRSLSCEVCPGGEGCVYFGDDVRGHVMSYTFSLKDVQARGLKRWYSILVLVREPCYLLSAWSFMQQHLQQLVIQLQDRAAQVFSDEGGSSGRQVAEQQLQQPRRQRVSSRGLPELLNYPGIWQRLHAANVWLMLAVGTRISEVIGTSVTSLLQQPQQQGQQQEKRQQEQQPQTPQRQQKQQVQQQQEQEQLYQRQQQLQEQPVLKQQQQERDQLRLQNQSVEKQKVVNLKEYTSEYSENSINSRNVMSQFPEINADEFSKRDASQKFSEIDTVEELCEKDSVSGVFEKYITEELSRKCSTLEVAEKYSKEFSEKDVQQIFEEDPRKKLSKTKSTQGVSKKSTIEGSIEDSIEEVSKEDTTQEVAAQKDITQELSERNKTEQQCIEKDIIMQEISASDFLLSGVACEVEAIVTSRELRSLLGHKQFEMLLQHLLLGFPLVILCTEPSISLALFALVRSIKDLVPIFLHYLITVKVRKMSATTLQLGTSLEGVEDITNQLGDCLEDVKNRNVKGTPDLNINICANTNKDDEPTVTDFRKLNASKFESSNLKESTSSNITKSRSHSDLFSASINSTTTDACTANKIANNIFNGVNKEINNTSCAELSALFNNGTTTQDNINDINDRKSSTVYTNITTNNNIKNTDNIFSNNCVSTDNVTRINNTIHYSNNNNKQEDSFDPSSCEHPDFFSRSGSVIKNSNSRATNTEVTPVPRKRRSTASLNTLNSSPSVDVCDALDIDTLVLRVTHNSNDKSLLKVTGSGSDHFFDKTSGNSVDKSVHKTTGNGGNVSSNKSNGNYADKSIHSPTRNVNNNFFDKTTDNANNEYSDTATGTNIANCFDKNSSDINMKSLKETTNQNTIQTFPKPMTNITRNTIDIATGTTIRNSVSTSNNSKSTEATGGTNSRTSEGNRSKNRRNMGSSCPEAPCVASNSSNSAELLHHCDLQLSGEACGAAPSLQRRYCTVVRTITAACTNDALRDDTLQLTVHHTLHQWCNKVKLWDGLMKQQRSNLISNNNKFNNVTSSDNNSSSNITNSSINNSNKMESQVLQKECSKKDLLNIPCGNTINNTSTTNNNNNTASNNNSSSNNTTNSNKTTSDNKSSTNSHKTTSNNNSSTNSTTDGNKTTFNNNSSTNNTTKSNTTSNNNSRTNNNKTTSNNISSTNKTTSNNNSSTNNTTNSNNKTSSSSSSYLFHLTPPSLPKFFQSSKQKQQQKPQSPTRIQQKQTQEQKCSAHDQPTQQCQQNINQQQHPSGFNAKSKQKPQRCVGLYPQLDASFARAAASAGLPINIGSPAIDDALDNVWDATVIACDSNETTLTSRSGGTTLPIKNVKVDEQSSPSPYKRQPPPRLKQSSSSRQLLSPDISALKTVQSEANIKDNSTVKPVGGITNTSKFYLYPFIPSVSDASYSIGQTISSTIDVFSDSVMGDPVTMGQPNTANTERRLLPDSSRKNPSSNIGEESNRASGNAFNMKSDQDTRTSGGSAYGNTGIGQDIRSTSGTPHKSGIGHEMSGVNVNAGNGNGSGNVCSFLASVSGSVGVAVPVLRKMLLAVGAAECDVPLLQCWSYNSCNSAANTDT